MEVIETDCTFVHSDDLFDIVLHEEEKCAKSAYNSGFLAGKMHGLTEGKSLGKKKGVETAQELGYYYGFCQTFIVSFEKNIEKTKSEQKTYFICQNIVSTIQSLVAFDPLILGKLANIRSQFKQACALLNLKVSYQGIHAINTVVSF